jgi:hypothetical protein
MKNKLILLAVFTSLLILAGCSFDNYDPPTSSLSGNVVYNNVPVGVRSGATQLELWQYKWDTKGIVARAKIAVYINQDGSYAARLFDGDYKLVRLKGGPWADQTDSISVTVKGNTTVDVPVTPFFTITNPTFAYNKADSTVTGTCTVSKVGTFAITSLTLYVGITSIVDANNNVQSSTLNAAALTDLTTPKTITFKMTNVTPTFYWTNFYSYKTYIYVRFGVLSAGSGERYYTPWKKISRTL